MADLIDRDKLLKYIDIMSIKDCISNPVIEATNTMQSLFKQVVEAMPKADTERHAHWIFLPNLSSHFDKKYMCSECKNIISVYDEKYLTKYSYCNCGCKMDGVIAND